MANKKKIRKSIESYDEKIKEHEEKINNHQDKEDYVIKYWEKEIDEFKRKKQEKEKKL